MATDFVVQSFTRSARGGLRPDTPLSAESETHARRLASQLASRKAVVVAFMRPAEAGEEISLIAAYGEASDDTWRALTGAG